MDERELGSMVATEQCAVCGTALAVQVTASGSRVPDLCLVCYGDPLSAPPPAGPAEPVDPPSGPPLEAPQIAADDALPREVGTDVTAQES